MEVVLAFVAQDPCVNRAMGPLAAGIAPGGKGPLSAWAGCASVSGWK